MSFILTIITDSKNFYKVSLIIFFILDTIYIFQCNFLRAGRSCFVSAAALNDFDDGMLDDDVVTKMMT